ncbi:MAG: hypothetical protein WCA35_01080 [Kovacikia sp.]
MNTLDDASLIQKFVKREVTLLSNQNLRVESAFDSVQLLAKRGGLVATIKQTKDGCTIEVRQRSEYGQQVHQALIANNFIPIGDPGKSEFWQYAEYKPPAGYKLHCTEARFLWKEWWTRVRYSNRSAIQTDLLIHVRDTWYPIRESVCSQGLLYITTLVSEFVFKGTDQVIWLSKIPNHGSARQLKTTASAIPASVQAAAKKPSDQSSQEQLLTHPVIVAKELPSRPASSTPAEVPLSHTKEGLETTGLHSDLRQVVEIRQGKLYIMTALGEVVVEGANLKFRLNDEKPPAKKPINLNNYRDREAYAVNT